MEGEHLRKRVISDDSATQLVFSGDRIVRREDGVAVGGQDAIEVDADVQEDIGEQEIRALQPPKICWENSVVMQQVSGSGPLAA